MELRRQSDHATDTIEQFVHTHLLTNTLYLHLLQKKIMSDKLKNRLVKYLENNNNMAPTNKSDNILYTALMGTTAEE